jgi:hypothetical protein
MSRPLLHLTSVFLLTLFASAAVVNAAAKKKDHVVGSIWTYTITQGDKKETGTFRVYQLDIYKEDKKVGRATVKSADETTLTFTDLPELNGKAYVKKLKTGVCSGQLKKTDGSEWEFKAHIKEN